MAAVYQVFVIKSLLHRNRWHRDCPQEALRGASAACHSLLLTAKEKIHFIQTLGVQSTQVHGLNIAGDK